MSKELFLEPRGITEVRPLHSQGEVYFSARDFARNAFLHTIFLTTKKNISKNFAVVFLKVSAVNVVKTCDLKNWFEHAPYLRPQNEKTLWFEQINE